MFLYSAYACILGFIIDTVIGDPQWAYHPVRLLGRLIDISEGVLRKIFPDTKKGLTAAGGILVVWILLVSTGISAGILYSAYSLNRTAGFILESIICYFMISARSLKTESMKVYYKISEGDIEGGRQAVSMIVGRDTEKLDEKGIIKAAVETVAENFSDGVMAPVLYMLIGGGVFGAVYKAVNTMDSMVGYKNDKYIYFGKCAARLDDVLNFIPSRVSAVLLILGAFMLKKDYVNAFRIFKRDRFNHKSPNSAQTEAVCAGALRIRLAGDAYYFGKGH